MPGDRIFFVQLADAPRLQMDVLSWSRHFRNFPGQGGLDVTGFVRAVLASGYAGPLSLEVFNDDFRSAPARLNAASCCSGARCSASCRSRKRQSLTAWCSAAPWSAPAGRVRLALNASDSRGTATGRFISTFAGAGVHHVALSTPDIGRAASALEALGAPVLPMPENCCDDLAAR